jgi:hypothetical protein
VDDAVGVVLMGRVWMLFVIIRGYLFVRPWVTGRIGLAGQFDLKPAPAAQDLGGEIHLE